MPKYVCCFERGGADWYFEWSTVVDAPVTDAMPREKMRALIARRDGEREPGDDHAPDARLDRAKARGCSSLVKGDTPLSALFRGNRAGENESEMTAAALLDELYAERDCGVIRNTGEGEE